MLFSMPISRLQRLFHVFDVFHDFDFVSFLFRSPAFFEIFFFRPSLLLVAARACFCAVTGDGHYSTSRGVAYPLEPYSLIFSSTLALPPPPRSFPHFKRPPPFHTVPHRAGKSQYHTKSQKTKMPHVRKSGLETSRNERSMIMRFSAPPSPLRPQRISPHWGQRAIYPVGTL